LSQGSLNLLLMNGRVINMDNVNMLDMCDKHVIIQFKDGEEYGFDDPDEVTVLGEYFNGILPDVADPNTRARLIKVSAAFRQQMYVQADRVMMNLAQPDPSAPDFKPGPGFAGAANPPVQPGQGQGDGFNPQVMAHLADPESSPRVKPGGPHGAFARGQAPSSVRPNPRGCGGCGKENKKAKGNGN
jgi:hypothetical protein